MGTMTESAKNQYGYLLVYAVVLMFGLMTVGIVTLSIVSASYTFTRDDVHRKNAVNMARACAKIIQDELSGNPDFTGFSPPAKVLYDRTNQSGSRSTCIVDNISSADNKKIVQLTTYEYRRDNDPNPVSYDAQAVFEAEDGEPQLSDYLMGGFLIGHGGITINSVSDISASRMNIFGKLTIQNVGDLTINDNGPLYVHNIACGTTDWPRKCTGENPISTPGVGRINGDICAPGQSSSAGLYSLNPSCTLPEISMPTFDKAGFISGMTGPTIAASTILGSGGCWYPDGFVNRRGQTFIVPANAKITGNLDLSSLPVMLSGTCKIEFQGNAYISGGITGSFLAQSGNIEFTVSDSMSDDVTIVMNRGLDFSNTSKFAFTPNENGNLLHIISFQSVNASCSDNTSVPSATVSTCLTPQQAKDSATLIENSGIKFGLYVNDRPLHGMTLYLYYSMADLGCGVGDTHIAAIAAQGLRFCGASADLVLTSPNPTFGIPDPDGGTPSTAGYKLVDFH